MQTDTGTRDAGTRRVGDREKKLTREEMETRRIAAAALLRKGVTQAAVAKQAGVSRTTASRWAAAVRKGENLARRPTPGRPHSLTAEQRAAVWRNFCTQQLTAQEVRDKIEEYFGVSYSHEHVQRMLWKMGAPRRPRRGADHPPEGSGH